MSKPTIYTIDLNFQGIPGAIASYLIPHKNGAILIESGPGSTIQALVRGLEKFGYTPADVTDVLLTHIHLDHAGAAGWLARQGARIHVHPNGAPHLINPEKLLASAQRIYGDQMDSLWGDFLPVPEDHLSVLRDGEMVKINQWQFSPIDTPGHASHHYTYLLGDVCFSGDVAGIRLSPQPYLRLPMPPPEFHIEKWRQSLKRLQKENIRWIAPTHFGIYNDPDWHLAEAARCLDAVESWMEANLTLETSLVKLREDYSQWIYDMANQHGMDAVLVAPEEVVNPSYMSADGILRYWKKYRAEGANNR